jgi:hypothetical protein
VETGRLLDSDIVVLVAIVTTFDDREALAALAAHGVRCAWPARTVSDDLAAGVGARRRSGDPVTEAERLARAVPPKLAHGPAARAVRRPASGRAQALTWAASQGGGSDSAGVEPDSPEPPARELADGPAVEPRREVASVCIGGCSAPICRSAALGCAAADDGAVADPVVGALEVRVECMRSARTFSTLAPLILTALRSTSARRASPMPSGAAASRRPGRSAIACGARLSAAQVTRRASG